MARCRFVQPRTVRLPLSDGDWMDVKGELSAGEERDMYATLRRQLQGDKATVADYSLLNRGRLLAYLLAWSLTDADGTPVPVSAGALDQMTGPDFVEMAAALDAHIDALITARTTEKNSRDGATASAPISPSVAP
jgi:hypothetical protein